MIWIIRLILLLAAPITGWMVARDSLQFSIVQTFVASALIAVVVAALAFLPAIGRFCQKAFNRQGQGNEQ